ncbi:MAG: magnesium/cobalt transporter CorA [Proteobacteria bacterium]|nr:MAG: magnesium/cobalt transporter CorA [Pseudomonadota bacterium]
MAKMKKKLRKKYDKFFHRPPPGSSPGTVIAPYDPNPTRLVKMTYNAEDVQSQVLDSAQGLKSALRNDSVTWISLLGMQNITLIQELCHEFGIHRLTVEDVLNQYQRPKVEYFDEYTYITVHVPKPDSDSDVISILMGENFIITMQDSATDYLDAIRNRILKKVGQIRGKDRSYLCYAIIDTVIDLYFPLTENYAQRIEDAESHILQASKPVAIIDVFSMRSKVNFFHRILWSHNQMISQLIHDPESPFQEDSFVYLRDCFDHTMQILEFLENLKENAKTLIDLHLSLQGHRSNEIMKVLTIITATFIPMTFISGLYGMNFDTSSPHNMPELHWKYGYPFAIMMMILAGGSMLIYFYSQRWFSNQAPLGQFDKDEDKPKIAGN